jgi:putative molybdopterin biosynthesis protein
MKITLETRWVLDGEPLDTRVLELLRAIDRTGSLARGRGDVLSYRQAWAKLGSLAKRLGEPLVRLERGRGSKLTPLGAALVAADRQAGEALASPHRRLVAGLAEVLERVGSSPAGMHICAHASHDLALAALRERLHEAEALDLDLHFRGSLDALDDLLEGRCDMAGFHIPCGRLAGESHSLFARRLLRKPLAIVHFATRCQGLMLPHGNPRRIRQLAHLTRPGIRFINRQPGSGTRLLFDSLLADAAVNSSRITGYGNEEFTHAAVAASVASGMADAGFGIEAAARQAHLAFVALARERYFLAFRDPISSCPAAGKLLAFLRSAAWRSMLAGYPGYLATGAGRPVSASTMLANERRQ